MEIRVLSSRDLVFVHLRADVLQRRGRLEGSVVSPHLPDTSLPQAFSSTTNREDEEEPDEEEEDGHDDDEEKKGGEEDLALPDSKEKTKFQHLSAH